jgi:hypothetical protein
VRSAAALACIALALGSCGGDDDDTADAGGDSAGISNADVQQAGVDYARCMREHGMDVPDPQGGAGGLRGMLVDGDQRDRPGFRDAERDCRRHLQGLVAQVSDEQRQELRQGRLEFARCMRGEGFDVPDPQPGAGPDDGGGPLGGLDVDDPRVQAAMDKCQPAASSLTDDE